MNIKEYIELGNSIEVPEIVLNRFDETIEYIGTLENANKRKIINWSDMNILAKVASIFIALLAFAAVGMTTKAFLDNMTKIRNTSDEETVFLYENVFKDYTGRFSRELTEEELDLETECFDKYMNNEASPKEQVDIIEFVSEYKGKGVSYCKEDGILYLPDKTMSEEEMLECIEFAQFSLCIDYERYRAATDSEYYLNDLNALTSKEIENIYVLYFGANTDTALYSRDLTISEKIMLRNYRKLYMCSNVKPEKTIKIIKNESEYSGESVAFCETNACYYISEGELTREDILEIIDLDIKAEYSFTRLEEEIAEGIRTEMPYIEPKKRERIITLDSNIQVDSDIINQPWMQAYSEVIEEEFDRIIKMGYENAETYYANVCFIYLNDDNIPEMLLKISETGFDYDDRCNYKDSIYTYRNDEAVKLKAMDSNIRENYNEMGKFKYVERKGKVYLDSSYEYSLSTLEVDDNEEDCSMDNLTRVDTWNSDLSACVHSNANLYIEHRIIDSTDLDGNHAWENARFFDEYFTNVTDVDFEQSPNIVHGERTSKEKYEKANEALWGGEKYITLEPSDFDKIYMSDNVKESLARAYMKK